MLSSKDIKSLENLIIAINIWVKKIEDYFKGEDSLRDRELKLFETRKSIDGIFNTFFRILNNSANKESITAIEYMLQKFIEGEIHLSPENVQWDDTQEENLLNKVYKNKYLHLDILSKTIELEKKEINVN